MSARPSNLILGRSDHSLSVVATVAAVVVGFTYVRWLLGQRSRHLDAELLTYTDVITYFVEKRPDDDLIQCGALLRAYDSKAWTMSFVFLDGANSICASADGARYGQTLRIKNLDEELVELFGGKDLVIFQ
jgi:hypothetical protein